MEKGRKIYGRHEGLKCVKELYDADLIKYKISTLEGAKKVIDGLKKATVLLRK